MSSRMPRRLKNSVMRNSGFSNAPGRPASIRSSVCRTMSRCFAEGGTRVTMSLSNVTMPTRSRWVVAK